MDLLRSHLHKVRIPEPTNRIHKDECCVSFDTPVCCAEDGQYLCFARGQNEWVIYNGETVEAAYSWQDLLRRNSQTQLRPEILFFERIK